MRNHFDFRTVDAVPRNDQIIFGRFSIPVSDTRKRLYLGIRKESCPDRVSDLHPFFTDLYLRHILSQTCKTNKQHKYSTQLSKKQGG